MSPVQKKRRKDEHPVPNPAPDSPPVVLPEDPTRPPVGPDADRVPAATLGSYGNASIDRWDSAFLAASEAVMRKKGVRVDPHFMKAVMDVESGGDGTYPASKCRPSDGFDNVPACGPMQIKQKYHQQRCPECDFATVPGQIELATHIIGDTMKARGKDEYDALVTTYFPGGDINGTTQAAYVNRVRSLVATMSGGTTPPPADPWRPYPYPKMVDLLVQKPAEGAGFDRVPFRRPQIRGFATHITDGGGTIEWLAAFFSTGGARAWDALTDTSIGRDGRIGLMNDWRNPNRGGTRAGWANGGVDGLEGDGVAFYRRFPAINSTLVSCEHIARDGEAWTDAMIASTIELRTAIAQELKCPWDAYPYHPSYGGVSIEQQHRNFATKSCPANPYISTYDAVVKREVKAKLKAWQGGGAGEPPPEPKPVWYTRFGFSLEDITEFFGTMTRYNTDGTTDELPFDVRGPLSLLWLNRGDREGKFPESERIWYSDAQFVEGKEVWASWEGGLTAYLPLDDSRASWGWLDEVEKKE
jgi:hypothetical protein